MSQFISLSCVVFFVGALSCSPNHGPSAISAPMSESIQKGASHSTEDLPRPLFSDDSVALSAVDFLDGQTGVIAGSAEYLALTSDAGNSWRKIDIRPPIRGTRAGEYDLIKVLLLSSRRIVAIGHLEEYGSAVFMSDDMGKTWNVDEHPGLSLNDIAADSDALWLVGNTGEEGRLFRINSQGKLEVVWKLKKGFLSNISFSSKGFGVAVGVKGLIVWKGMNGNAWTTKYVADDKNLTTVAFTRDGDGIALSADGTIIRFLDKDGSWSVDDVKVRSGIRKLVFGSKNDLWTISDTEIERRSAGNLSVNRSIEISANDIDTISNKIFVATRNSIYRFDH